MPSYAKVLTETYLPAQSAKLRWESAKTVAGAQFDALAEQRKAVDEVRLRRQQYADNIRAREGSADAFMFQAMQAQVGVQPPGSGGGGGGGAREAVDAGIKAIKALPGSTVFKTGSAEEQLVRNTFNVAKSVEQKQRVIDAAVARGYRGSLVIPAGTLSEKTIEKEAREGDAAAQAQYLALVGRAQATIDLADNLGPRGFQGGTKAREFYENLTDNQQELARIYASALLDDGVVTAEEVPEGQLEEARKLHGEIEAKGAYRLQDKAAFDQGYLDLLKDLNTKEGALKEAEGRLQGKTKETLAEELYTGATERAAIPPLLRSLEPDMKRYLEGYTSAASADPSVDPEAYLRSKMTDREAKGYSAASAMAASGMRAQDIMDNLQALSPEERRSVMGALASRDAIAATRMKVAPGTPLPEIEKIKAEDLRAQEAELARTESRLQARLRQLDESLAAGRDSGFGGIVSPDSAASKPADRRSVLMGALTPEELDRQEVERIAAERELARIERDRMGDTGEAGYDPSLNLPAPVVALDGNRGAAKAGNDDRAEIAGIVAGEDLARRDAAVEKYRGYSGMGLDPRALTAIREALLGGVAAPRQPEFVTRADLRPEPFQMEGAQAPTPAPAPVTTPVEPTPPPEKIMRRVWNEATQQFDLVEVK